MIGESSDILYCCSHKLSIFADLVADPGCAADCGAGAAGPDLHPLLQAGAGPRPLAGGRHRLAGHQEGRLRGAGGRLDQTYKAYRHKQKIRAGKMGKHIKKIL